MIENNPKNNDFWLLYVIWCFKTEECKGSVTAVQCFRKTNSEIIIKKTSVSTERKIQIRQMLLYVKKKEQILNFYSGGEREK